MTRGAIVYVDGLNVYHGLCDARFREYRWLDVWRLAERMLWPSESLLRVRYFNAPAVDTYKRKRQEAFNEALRATGVQVHLGVFAPKYWYCSDCGVENTRSEEKQSDVALGSHLTNDVYCFNPDTVVIMSGDGDMCAIIPVLDSIPDRPKIRIASPPARKNRALIAVADEHRLVKKKHLVRVPNPVAGPNGPIYEPEVWTKYQAA